MPKLRDSQRAVTLDKTMSLRWTKTEYSQLTRLARAKGYSNLAEMIRREMRQQLQMTPPANNQEATCRQPQ